MKPRYHTDRRIWLLGSAVLYVIWMTMGEQKGGRPLGMSWLDFFRHPLSRDSIFGLFFLLALGALAAMFGWMLQAIVVAARFATIDRFRFGLRTMFAVVAVACCWASYQLNWISDRKRFLKSHELQRERLHLTTTARASLPRTPPGMLWIFGENGVAYVAANDQSEMEEARRLFPEADIYLP